MANEILNMELSQEDENLLRESLITWKEGVYADLLEQVEEVKSAKIEELEAANIQYQSELKESFAHKMVMALDEMRPDIRAEVISEMILSNPELQILEKIKELVAPTLNEEYQANIYTEEIVALKEENDYLKQQAAIDEGASTLAELIGPYSEKTQNIILAMVKEGNSEEVTEQFYELIESLGAINENDDDLDEEEEEEEEEEDDEDYDEEDDDEDMDEDTEEDGDTYIKEDSESDTKKAKTNSLKDQIANLAK
jgi:hypothetical protein